MVSKSLEGAPCPEIEMAAGYTLKEMMLNIVVIGGVMVLSVFITIFTVDKFGRKKLLLVGTAAMAILYLFIWYAIYIEQGGLVIVFLVVNNVMFIPSPSLLFFGLSCPRYSQPESEELRFPLLHLHTGLAILP